MSQTNKPDETRGKVGPAQRGGKRHHAVLRWRIAALVLCTLGAALSADLIRLHHKVHTDPGYHSYCAISEWANCETVAASEHAVALGLPVAVWGLLGYLAMGTLIAWGLRRPLSPASWPFGVLFSMAAFSSVLSIFLYVVSHVVIESVCLVCMGTYLVNLGLLALAVIELRRLGLGPVRALVVDIRACSERPRKILAFGGVFAVAIVVLWSTVPTYWEIQVSGDHVGVSTGQTRDGYPWIGAEQPMLIVAEYSDYQCPHCRRGHDAMRRLITDHPEKVRLVHRHYPLDQACNTSLTKPFHPFACAYAMMAYCAEEQGLFWEVNDYLFANGRRKRPISSEELGEAFGVDAERLEACRMGNAAGAAIRNDLGEGQSMGVRGTPTFVIDGKTYPGAVPDEILERYLRVE